MTRDTARKASLASIIAGTSHALMGAVPEPVLDSARLHFLDAMAVGMAARVAGPVRGVSSLPAVMGGPGPSTILGSQEGTTAPVAALVNGTLIHSLEYDDTHVASVMHGSSVMAPAALAAAQTARVDGRTMLEAFTLGWELLIRIGLASPGTLQRRGFQTTSAGGPFAAALAAALVSGGPVEVTTNALGIAGSQPGGSFAFLEHGDTVKAAQPGWAAHSGVWAAALARAGISGPERVFEGQHGFFRLYAGDDAGAQRLREHLTSLGVNWYLPDAAFKLLPVCHYIHPFVECLEQIQAAAVTQKDVVDIHCWVPEEVIGIIAEPWAEKQSPRRAHDARWSLPYTLAAFLHRGILDITLFDGEPDEQFAETAGRVTYEPWRGTGFPSRFSAKLSVRLRDGRTMFAEVDDVRGSALRPSTAISVIEKAAANLALAGLTAGQSDHLVAEITQASNPDLCLIGSLLGAGHSSR